MTEHVKECVKYLRKKTDIVPVIALILGSGLGHFGECMDVDCEVPYEDLPDFPRSTVEGHEGRFLIGHVGDAPVIVMQGRVHYYEGYTPQQVVLPLRVMRAMGARILLVTNAAGGIKDTYHPGTLALITDQISFYVPNPLIGPNDDDDGPRFPDMSEIYDRELRVIVQRAAVSSGIYLDQGVYCQVSGPSFETPVEIRMLSMLGVDLVGMSTAMETVVARQLGMRVCGISLVTNYAAGISARPLSHEEVFSTAEKASDEFERLVTAAVKAIHERFGMGTDR